MRDRRIVDEHVQTSEFGADAFRRGVDRGLVRDIELKRSAFSPTSRSAACPVAKSREPTSTIIALVASCLAT